MPSLQRRHRRSLSIQANHITEKERNAKQETSLGCLMRPGLQIIHFFLGISDSIWTIGLPETQPSPRRWTFKQPSNVEAGGVRNISKGLMAHDVTKVLLPSVVQGCTQLKVGPSHAHTPPSIENIVRAFRKQQMLAKGC